VVVVRCTTLLDLHDFMQIYQVSGPVERFAGQIASQGYICACPSSFHEFEGPEALPYDTEGQSRVSSSFVFSVPMLNI